MRVATTVLCAVVFVGAAGVRHARDARGADLTPGMLRTAQNREGAWIREQPTPLAKRLTRIPYGDQVKIVEVRELWARVSTVTEPVATGWTRANDLIEPGALAGGSSVARGLSASEVSAAGRQLLPHERHSAGKHFDFVTEGRFKVSEPRIAAAYPLVDWMEKQRPSDEYLERFIREGRLGGTTEAGAEAAGGTPAKLVLFGATGDVEGVTTFEDAFTPLPTPVTDEDFANRMGVGFTPEHEYWLGRAVAAAAIAEHGLDPDMRRQALVQRIGASIVTLSGNLRQTHGGYCFAVLNTATPNGIAGPGGFVLLSRGAVDLARNEDEVAAIIAHELAHIAYKHGEQMVRKTREFQDGMVEVRQRAKRAPLPGDDCSLCVEVAKVLGTSAKSLVSRLDTQGYERELELAADWAGSLYLCEVGYRPSAVAEYMELVPTREGARWTTHPSSEERIEALRPLVFKHGCPFDADAGAAARLPRFRSLGFMNGPK